MHAKVTAYGNHLILELLSTKSCDTLATSLDRPQNMGQVIIGSDTMLGVSAEAIELLKKIEPGHDAIGDVDWFIASDDRACFCWFGGPNRIIDVTDREIVAARGFQVREGRYVTIPNEPNPDAVKAITG